MTTRALRPLPLTRSMLSLRGALAHGEAALESDRGRFIVAGIGAGLVLSSGSRRRSMPRQSNSPFRWPWLCSLLPGWVSVCLLKPGLLTDEERAFIQQHTAWGEELLAGQSDFALARSIARSHHENWDGTGYPDRRAGSDIPFPARIVRIVDVYDALRRDRPYKAAWSIERTMDEMRAMRGKSFDQELTDLFLAMATRTA